MGLLEQEESKIPSEHTIRVLYWAKKRDITPQNDYSQTLLAVADTVKIVRARPTSFPFLPSSHFVFCSTHLAQKQGGKNGGY
jgi:hypothetical protein